MSILQTPNPISYLDHEKITKLAENFKFLEFDLLTEEEISEEYFASKKENKELIKTPFRLNEAVREYWIKLKENSIVMFYDEQFCFKEFIKPFKFSQNDQDIVGKFKTGDLIFFENDKKSLSSNLISFFTDEKITHVAMVIELPYKVEETSMEILPETLISVKKELYLWEMGTCKNIGVLCAEGKNPKTSCRLSKLSDVLKKTNESNVKIYSAHLFPTEKYYDYFSINHKSDRLEAAWKILLIRKWKEYFIKRFGDDYDIFISRIWTHESIIPFNNPAFHYSTKKLTYSDIKANKVKHCSQLIYNTLIHLGVFSILDENFNSYDISPGNLFHHLNAYCTPFFKFSTPKKIEFQ